MTSLLVALALVGCLVAGAAAQPACAPTRPDMLGPFYKPDAPERARTGSGRVVSGAVRSTKGGPPLPGARVEWWSADQRGEYRDALRATQHTDPEGRFAYETVVPGRYPGRPPHLHVRVSAPGHKTLVTQLYPGDGQRSLATDFVLVPD